MTCATYFVVNRPHSMIHNFLKRSYLPIHGMGWSWMIKNDWLQLFLRYNRDNTISTKEGGLCLKSACVTTSVISINF